MAYNSSTAVAFKKRICQETERFHGLPPLKRFKLLEKERQLSNCCLPAKKRVCAWKIFSLGDVSGEKKVEVDVKEEQQAAVFGNEVCDNQEDGVVCDVCRETDADEEDPIVFCDGCDVMVHASCYGYPLSQGIPSGDWFCCRCTEGGREQRCCLCRSKKGVMKRTTDGKWAHLYCALYVPEAYYRKAKEREGIECGRVPSWRAEMECGLCREKGGACIQCTETECIEKFHVSCALDANLAIEYRYGGSSNTSKKPAIVIAFCTVHTPYWRSEKRRNCKIVYRDDLAE